jgi:hypothetical protein
MQCRDNKKQDDKDDGCDHSWVVAEELEIDRFFGHHCRGRD